MCLVFSILLFGFKKRRNTQQFCSEPFITQFTLLQLLFGGVISLYTPFTAVTETVTLWTWLGVESTTVVTTNTWKLRVIIWYILSQQLLGYAKQVRYSEASFPNNQGRISLSLFYPFRAAKRPTWKQLELWGTAVSFLVGSVAKSQSTKISVYSEIERTHLMAIITGDLHTDMSYLGIFISFYNIAVSLLFTILNFNIKNSSKNCRWRIGAVAYGGISIEFSLHTCTMLFLADRTATQYDRLLASSCCPSVCLSVCLWRCAFWLSGLVYGAKSYTSVLLASMFLFVPFDTFAVACIV